MIQTSGKNTRSIIFYQKLTLNPRSSKRGWVKRGFVSVRAAPCVTLARLFSTPPRLAHFLCLPLPGLTYQARHSHTHGDGSVWPGHPARLRGVSVRKCAAAALRWTAGGFVVGWRLWPRKGSKVEGDWTGGVGNVWSIHALHTKFAGACERSPGTCWPTPIKTIR